MLALLMSLSVAVSVGLYMLATSPWADGYISKLAMLTGIKLVYLEKTRWTLVKSSKSENSKHLVVAFAGGALRLAMMPQPEFVRTLADFDCDKLFLTDPLQSWYLNDPDCQWRGYEYHEQRLREFVSKYDRVMFIGNCLGATGALLFSHLATRVVTFNPQVDIELLNGLVSKWAVNRVPLETRRAYLQRMAQNLAVCPKIIVHVGTLKKDQEQIESLEKMCASQGSQKEGHLEIVKHQWDQDNLPGSLKKHSQLVPILQQAFQEMLSS